MLTHTHGETTTVSRACLYCHTGQVVEVPTESLIRYQQGALAQDAFPALTPDEREILISGICGACFDRMADQIGEE